MATNIEKFLNQAGVSTLWSRVAEEVAKVDQKVETNASNISTLKLSKPYFWIAEKNIEQLTYPFPSQPARSRKERQVWPI